MTKTERTRNIKYRPQKKQKHKSEKKNKMIRERKWRSKHPELFEFVIEIPYWRKING